MTAAVLGSVGIIAFTVASARLYNSLREQLEAACLARDTYRLELLRAYAQVNFMRAVLDLPPDPHAPVLQQDLSRTARSQETAP